MFGFLQPISNNIIEYVSSLPAHTIGKNIQLHTDGNVPNLKEGMLVLLSVSENRYNVNHSELTPDFDDVRKQIYALAKGNWNFELADIGEIAPGNTVEDTYFAVTLLVKELIKLKCIPIFLGGGQDIVYAQYKAYDPNNGMVNMVNIDSRLDLGNVDRRITNQSFVGKIVVGEPYNLFNYTNLGYQSYYVAPEELDLMNKMYFDSYRLGELVNNTSIAEPVLRDADIVSLDLTAIEAIFYDGQPNGFSSREICSLSRYAGISDKVSIFGMYEYDSQKSNVISNALIAQMFWYFAEGVSCRWNESSEIDNMDLVHYQVPVEEEVFSFYKSRLTERWWMNVRYSNALNNNLELDTLLPCTYQDYEQACNQIVPERWYNAKMKYEM